MRVEMPCAHPRAIGGLRFLHNHALAETRGQHLLKFLKADCRTVIFRNGEGVVFPRRNFLLRRLTADVDAGVAATGSGAGCAAVSVAASRFWAGGSSSSKGGSSSHPYESRPLYASNGTSSYAYDSSFACACSSAPGVAPSGDQPGVACVIASGFSSASGADAAASVAGACCAGCAFRAAPAEPRVVCVMLERNSDSRLTSDAAAD